MTKPPSYYKKDLPKNDGKNITVPIDIKNNPLYESNFSEPLFAPNPEEPTEKTKKKVIYQNKSYKLEEMINDNNCIYYDDGHVLNVLDASFIQTIFDSGIVNPEEITTFKLEYSSRNFFVFTDNKGNSYSIDRNFEPPEVVFKTNYNEVDHTVDVYLLEPDEYGKMIVVPKPDEVCLDEGTTFTYDEIRKNHFMLKFKDNAMNINQEDIFEYIKIDQMLAYVKDEESLGAKDITDFTVIENSMDYIILEDNIGNKYKIHKDNRMIDIYPPDEFQGDNDYGKYHMTYLDRKLYYEYDHPRDYVNVEQEWDYLYENMTVEEVAKYKKACMTALEIYNRTNGTNFEINPDIMMIYFMQAASNSSGEIDFNELMKQSIILFKQDGDNGFEYLHTHPVISKKEDITQWYTRRLESLDSLNSTMNMD